MSIRNEMPYETIIVNLLTNERYQLAEVIARHSRATGTSLEEADIYIKELIGNPISNLRVADVDDLEDFDEESDDDSLNDGFRAQIATQTLLAATTMLNSNIPSPPMQERLRRLAHAAVEDLELFYFGEEDEDHDHEHDHHDHDHGHKPHEHGAH